jgi:hypothetical protein
MPKEDDEEEGIVANMQVDLAFDVCDYMHEEEEDMENELAIAFMQGSVTYPLPKSDFSGLLLNQKP